MKQFDTLLPDDKQACVENALQRTFGTSTPEEVRLITGGLSSALVYRVRIAEQECVLRVAMARDELRDPVRHFKCLNLAGEAGIAPPVLYTNADEGISITRFIEHVGFPPDTLSRLVEVIKQIHALPLFPPLIGFLDGVDAMIAQFHANGLLAPELTAEHFRYYAQIQRAYPRHDPDLVSSHNDLNPGNMLFDGEKLWLVDWEAAFRNDRYVDLALAANYFLRAPEQLEPFLAAYFGESLTDYNRDRFFLMRCVCRMYYAMVFLNMAAATGGPDFQADQCMEAPTVAEWMQMMGAGQIPRETAAGQVLSGKAFLNECLRHMQTPQFEEAIHHMEQHAA